MEYMRSSLRTVGLSICIGFFYCIGSMSAPWIAVLMTSWQGYLLATALPLGLVPLFYFIVPESVQWLISIQKYEKAVKCLKFVAKVNGRRVEESDYTQFVDECKFSQQRTKTAANLIDLFRTPRLRRNTLILFFKSWVHRQVTLPEWLTYSLKHILSVYVPPTLSAWSLLCATMPSPATCKALAFRHSSCSRWAQRPFCPPAC